MKRHRILITDDNEENRYFLRALLQGSGYEVALATHGADALSQARQRKPDLIVADIFMPVMDGFTLCRECKKDPRLRHIPFIFYTATYTDQKDKQFALDLGAVAPERHKVLRRVLGEAVEEIEPLSIAAPWRQLHPRDNQGHPFPENVHPWPLSLS